MITASQSSSDRSVIFTVLVGAIFENSWSEVWGDTINLSKFIKVSSQSQSLVKPYFFILFYFIAMCAFTLTAFPSVYRLSFVYSLFL